jgi:hypothetical protein
VPDGAWRASGALGVLHTRRGSWVDLDSDAGADACSRIHDAVGVILITYTVVDVTITKPACPTAQCFTGSTFGFDCWRHLQIEQSHQLNSS